MRNSKLRNDSQQTVEGGKASKSPTYAPPIEKPQVVDLSSAYSVKPFVLYTHASYKKPSGYDSMTAAAQIKSLIANDKNIVVAVARLNLLQYQQFAREYGCDIQSFVGKIMAVSTYEALGPEQVPNVDYSEEAGAYVTPYGIMRGTTQENAIEVAAFLLSAHGRIVGLDPDNEYGYEFADIDPNVVKRLLDLSFFDNLVDYEETSPFMMLIEETYAFRKAASKASEAEKLIEEELEKKA